MMVASDRTSQKMKDENSGGRSKLVTIAITILCCLWISINTGATAAALSPRAWPHQFHSILLMNYSGTLQIIDLWYDWTNGRNFNIIQEQLSNDLLYDLEWNNGTSFVYTLNSSNYCRTSQLDVGILRPNWLAGATYLGQRHVDGFLCNVWEKVDFIWYYEDVLTHRPVHWLFYTGRAAHVMTFEVGAALEDSKWQAPPYCFNMDVEDDKTDGEADEKTIKMRVSEHQKVFF